VKRWEILGPGSTKAPYKIQKVAHDKKMDCLPPF
jgi:hypothetical protein